LDYSLRIINHVLKYAQFIEKNEELAMPKKNVVVTYTCDICHHEHTTEEKALACEARGLAVPEFKLHEVVKLVFPPPDSRNMIVSSGFRFNVENGTKMIINGNGRDEASNPHMLPDSYDAWIQTSGRPDGDHREIIDGISRMFLRRVSIKNGATCPLCGSVTHQIKELLFGLLGFGDGFSTIKNVPMHKCRRCGIVFFSDDQLRNAEFRMRSKSKWPIADTSRLTREHQFE